MKIHGIIWPRDRVERIARHDVTPEEVEEVEKPMKPTKLPITDSIEELARFWDTHDLTGFQDGLEEVPEPVFERAPVVKIHLQPKEMEAVKEMAESKGVDSEDLIRQWILERIRTA